MNYTSIYQYLFEFRNLPDYQLERRLDIFLVPFLCEAVKKKFNMDSVEILMPEFPVLRTKTMDDRSWNSITSVDQVRAAGDRLSSKIDFLLLCKKADSYCCFITELKTDVGSFDSKQYWTMMFHDTSHGNRKLKDLLVDYLQIASGSITKSKYRSGLQRMFNFLKLDIAIPDTLQKKWLTEASNRCSSCNLDYEVTMLYLGPEGIMDHLVKFGMSRDSFISLEELIGGVEADERFVELVREINGR